MQFIRITFVSSVFGSLMQPFYIIYFNTIGFSLSQITLLILLNHLCSMFFEIPTGVVADFFGRKISVLIAYSIAIFVPLGIYFSNNFIFILFLYSLAGIGSTFKSGAFHAWFVDNIIRSKKDNEDSDELLGKYWGKLSSADFAGACSAFVLGSVLFSKNIIKEIWLLEAIGMLVLFIYIFTLEEIKTVHEKKEKAKNDYFKEIITGSTFIIKNSKIFIPTMASAIFYFSSGLISMIWQPYFNNNNIKPKYFGIILTVYMFVAILSPILIGVITNKGKNQLKGLYTVCLGCSVTIIPMIFLPQYSFVFFILYGIVNSMESTIFQSYINGIIPSDIRATVLSTYGMIISFSTVLCTSALGILTRFLDLKYILWISCITVFVAGFVNLINNRLEKKSY